MQVVNEYCLQQPSTKWGLVVEMQICLTLTCSSWSSAEKVKTLDTQVKHVLKSSIY